MKSLRVAIMGLAMALACAWNARAAQIDAFTGGAVFGAASGVQTYFAQSTGGSKPLLQIFFFLANSHFLVQLRDTGTGAGSAEYQGYTDGKKRAGHGTYAIHGGVLKTRASGGFQFTASVAGSHIRLLCKDATGTFSAAGRLQKFP